MVASTRDRSEGDRSERDRQALLTFRLSTVIVVLSVLLGWMLADRYFGLGATVEALLEEPMTSPPNNELDKKPTCNVEAESSTERSVWAAECPAVNSSIAAPVTTTNVAGTTIKAL
jgi:hypothetical protein